MKLQALAMDYDGTVASEGRIPAETLKALERLGAAGIRRILVTGRERKDLFSVCERPELFDLMVLENGALLYDPASGRQEILGEPPSEALIDALRTGGVSPFVRGQVIVATFRHHEEKIRNILETLSCAWEMILNKNSLMLLPPGIDKASGLEAALKRLGLVFEDVAGIGDAENDLCFLGRCRLAAAVANALPSLKEKVHRVTAGEAGEGVRELIDHLLNSARSSERPSG